MEVSSVGKTALNCKRKNIKTFVQPMVSEDAANCEDYNETLKYSLYHIADKISSL